MIAKFKSGRCMKILNDLLTIVIPVKNEEKNLPACLENVREFEHVVLVDSGSTDDTRKVFDEMVARWSRSDHPAAWDWVAFKWDGKFPKKRNWVLRNYTFKTPWVLFLDADERLTEVWKREAADLLSSPDAERFDVIKCYYDNWFMDRLLRHGDLMQKTAMVRVGAAEYERIEEDAWSSLDMEIHEHLQPRRVNAEGEIHARLEHHDRRSLESYYAKHEQYANWEANRYRALKGDFSRLTRRQQIKYSMILKPWFGFAYFCACYFLKRGFLDGYPGYVFARGKMRYFRKIRRKILAADV